jgi:hypothetical protein
MLRWRARGTMRRAGDARRGARSPNRARRRAAMVLAAFSLMLSGCLGQLIIGHDVDPWLGHRWQDYDYAHPNAACGQPYADKYGRQYVRCSTDAYSVTFQVDQDGVIRSYQGELSDR